VSKSIKTEDKKVARKKTTDFTLEVVTNNPELKVRDDNLKSAPIIDTVGISTESEREKDFFFNL
jgi:hypothetical protein